MMCDFTKDQINYAFVFESSEQAAKNSHAEMGSLTFSPLTDTTPEYAFTA